MSSASRSVCSSDLLIWSLYYVCHQRATNRRPLTVRALDTNFVLARGIAWLLADYKRRTQADDLPGAMAQPGAALTTPAALTYDNFNLCWADSSTPPRR